MAELRSFADVEPLDPEDLWAGKIPRAQVTLLVGDSGIGKDFLMCDLAARVTRGDRMPDDTAGVPAGHVVMINPEDDPATTTVHRLKAAHADLGMVHDLTVVDGDLWQIDPDGMAALRRVITECGGARLVTISALGAVAPCSLSQEVTVRQKIMNPLSAVARDTGASILVTVHLTKQGAAQSARSRVAAKDGAGGSKGLTSAARTVLSVTRDKNDPRIRTLDVVKSNLTADDSSPVRYSLAGDWPATKVVWLAQVDDVAEEGAAKAGQDALLALLLMSSRPADAQSLAVAAGIDYATARVLLRRMTVQGLVVEQAGRYVLNTRPSPRPADERGRPGTTAGLA